MNDEIPQKFPQNCMVDPTKMKSGGAGSGPLQMALDWSGHLTI